MNKAAAIRLLAAEGVLSRCEIAEMVGCKPNYVSVILSIAKRPGYKARWMRESRENPKVWAAEKAARRAKYATDPSHRKRILEYMRRWRDDNRELYRAYQREWRRRQQEASP